MIGDAGAVPAPSPLERRSWVLFDFANSAFNTLVVTFVYSAFFAKVLVADETRGEALWGASLTVAALTVALAAPAVGAWADRRRGRKKRLVVALSALTIALTAGLAWPAPDPALGRAPETAIWTALVLVTAANIAFELMFSLYNAFLPELGDAPTLGRLSGAAWAAGYAGGLLCLAIGLGFVGIDGVTEPWLSTERHWNVRATNLLVAGWFLAFALPLWFVLVDRGGTAAAPDRRGLRASLRGVFRTLRSLREHPDLLRFLLARLLYNDAVVAIVALAGIYMTRTIGMEIGEAMVVAIWLNVVAGVSAWAFGRVDDRFGGKVAIAWSVAAMTAGATLAIAVPTAPAFWVAATLAGIGLGPSQSASRSLLARFIPASRSAEYYGFYALTGKGTTWIGPLLFTVVVAVWDSRRLGLVPLVVMLLLGLLVLLGVDERRGIARAAVDV